MIRLFHVHYPVRTLVFWVVQALVVFSSFLLGILLRFGDDSYLVLNFEYGYYKILTATALVLLFSHWFDLYDLAPSDAKGELYFRLLSILGFVGADVSCYWVYFSGIREVLFFSMGIMYSSLDAVRLAACLCMAGKTVVSQGEGLRTRGGRTSTTPG